MIRGAILEDFPSEYPTVQAIRIGCLKEAYGLDVPFIEFFSDGQGSLLSVMDGVGVFYAARPIDEEWTSFLTFYSKISVLCTDAVTGKWLAKDGWQMKSGTVLHFEGEIPQEMDPDTVSNPSLPAVHTLLSTCFADFPPFDGWYVDVNHRIRHGHCHIAAVVEQDRPVSVALTVAEAGGGAVLGQVGTDSAFRRRGYAGKCIKSLIFTMQGKRLYILPVDTYAEKLYCSLGFRSCGGWAELKRY